MGIGCRVVVPEGKVALGKLAQALVHGARIVVVRGGGMGEIFDIDARQCGAEGMLRLSQRGHYDFAEQGGVGNGLSIHLFGRPGCAHDIVGGDAALLARKLVTAARPSRSLKNAVAHQCLQHRLEMPRRQAMACR